MNTSKIKSIKKIIEINNRYDITVEDFSCYFANGILVHNTDGQNLMFSWIDGKLKAARSPKHIRNFGKDALSIKDIEQKYKGIGNLQYAFVQGMKDLESAIKKLSDKQKEKIFKNGKKFMSVEIIYPKTVNVIPYNYSMLVFHGTFEYDENGKIINSDKSEASMLAGMVKQVNANIQKEFEIKAPNDFKLPKPKDFSKQKSEFNSKLKSLQSEFSLKKTDLVTMYHQKWWEDFVKKQAKKMKYNIPDNVFKDLVTRWAYQDKKKKIVELRKKIKNEDFLKWMNDFDKNNHETQFNKNIEPFEILFLRLGATVLKNINEFLVSNPDESLKQIKSDIKTAISALEKSKDITVIQKLKKNLDKLEKIGGFDSIVPSEGLTFMYNDKLYKLTGAFAPINKINGLFKYK